jgi:integrase
MDHFAGLDVSVKETSLCIVDDAGRIVREVRVVSEPEALLAALTRGSAEHLSTRQYARLLAGWLAMIGLDPCFYGTHSLRRTKATLIYKKTGNLRAVQLLLGHTKIESTVRYLGIEVDNALAVAEQIDV